MPGISFIYHQLKDLEQLTPQILEALQSGLHDERFEQKTFIFDDHSFLGGTGYNDYPLTNLEDNEFFFLLEGKLYGKTHHTLVQEFNQLAKWMFSDQDSKENLVTKWLLETDGDFILFIREKKSGKMVLLNDALGRLPLYYYHTHGEIIVSRELRFITNLKANIQFDRKAIVQYLLFGYTLGKRTLWEGISYMKPATLIRMNCSNSGITFHTLHQFNFEEKKNKKTPTKEIETNLVKLFCEACKNRSNGSGENIVALSGGLDSRAVAAGLNKMKIPFRGATFLDHPQKALRDAELAEQLAGVFGVQWEKIHLNAQTGKEVGKLLRIKNGLNHLSMSFLISFLGGIQEKFGYNINLFSGQGGDTVWADHRPKIKLKSINTLVNYLILKNQILSIDEVSALTKVDQQTIISDLREHLNSYPEKDLHQKYVHFKVFERAFKWAYEGEDRSRFYCWSVAPFFSTKFFNYAMNCPDKMKSRNKLQRKFLLELSPQATAIPNAIWKFPITTNRLKIYLLVKDTLLYRQLIKIKRVLKQQPGKATPREQVSQTTLKCLLEQCENCPAISEYLCVSEIKRVIHLTSKLGVGTIFTITSAIEEFESNESTIQKYSDYTLI